MDIYFFDQITGEFLGGGKADLNPMASDSAPEVDRFFMPEFATPTAPPEAPEGQKARWTDDAWELVADHRGQDYYLPDGSHHIITELGLERPAEALDEAPPMPVHPTADAAINAAYSWIENLVHSQIDGGKPLSEIMTYQTRAAAARAVMAGTATADDTTLLGALLVASGVDAQAVAAGIPALAATIKAKADARDQALAFTTAMRDQVEALIEAADVEADAFVFDQILAQAAVDATAKWAELSGAQS